MQLFSVDGERELACYYHDIAFDPTQVSSEADFYKPREYEDIKLLRTWLLTIEDGSMLCCRGRDVVNRPKFDATILTEENENEGEREVLLSAWELGIVIKFKRDLFFMWQGKVESYPIGVLDM